MEFYSLVPAPFTLAMSNILLNMSGKQSLLRKCAFVSAVATSSCYPSPMLEASCASHKVSSLHRIVWSSREEFPGILMELGRCHWLDVFVNKLSRCRIWYPPEPRRWGNLPIELMTMWMVISWIALVGSQSAQQGLVLEGRSR